MPEHVINPYPIVAQWRTIYPLPCPYRPGEISETIWQVLMEPKWSNTRDRSKIRDEVNQRRKKEGHQDPREKWDLSLVNHVRKKIEQSE